MIHIGKLLQNYFETKRTRKAVLARLLQININSLMNYEKKESIQTARLLEICTNLQHNFFIEIISITSNKSLINKCQTTRPLSLIFI